MMIELEYLLLKHFIVRRRIFRVQVFIYLNVKKRVLTITEEEISIKIKNNDLESINRRFIQYDSRSLEDDIMNDIMI